MSDQVILISSDSVRIPVERKIIEKSLYIKNLLKNLKPEVDEDDVENGEIDADEQPEIPIANVTSDTLKKVLEWCEHYKDYDFPEEDEDDEEDNYKTASPVDFWDKNYLNVDADLLRSIILAANFLNIKPLLNSSCKVVADMIKGKSPEEIRAAFNAVQSK